MKNNMVAMRIKPHFLTETEYPKSKLDFFPRFTQMFAIKLRFSFPQQMRNYWVVIIV